MILTIFFPVKMEPDKLPNKTVYDVELEKPNNISSVSSISVVITKLLI